MRDWCKWGSLGGQNDRMIIKKGEIGGCRGCSGLVGEREGVFVKDDMARDYDFMCREVKATIAAMVRGVPEKNTRGCARS